MRHWTPEETLRLLQVAREEKVRDWCMILFAYKHALRASEVVGLKVSDVKNGYLDVQRLKGSLHSVQPLLANENELLDEQKALSAWMAEREARDLTSQFLFTQQEGTGMTRQNFWNILQKWGPRAGIDRARCFPHAAKHSFCTHLIHSGMDIAFVRVAAGHVDLKSTSRYCAISDEQAATKVSDTLQKVF